MIFKAVTTPQRPRLSDVVAQQIEQLIVDGVLTPGTALPPERELAGQLTVSRPSLREALLKLEARGLILGRRGGGYEIAAVTAPTITEPLVHLMENSSKVRRDVLELRRGLEGVAAYLAAERATEADLARLDHACLAMEAQREEGDGVWQAQADVDFHLAIADAAHNVALSHLSRGIFDLLRTSVHKARGALARDAEALDAVRRQHRSIVDAVQARDAPGARRAAETHLAFVQDNLAALDDSGRDGPPEAASRRR